MMTNSEVQKPDDATLVLRRVLNATPERVFKAWTSPEHIQQWMRPEPGMVRVKDCQLRPGLGQR